MTVYVMDLEVGREEESCEPEKMDTKPASMEKMTGWSRFK